MKSCKVTDALEHDGVAYAPGTTLETDVFSEGQRDRLLAAGVIVEITAENTGIGNKPNTGEDTDTDDETGNLPVAKKK